MKTELKDLGEFLNGISYFESLDEKSITQVIESLVIKNYLSGEPVIWEGDLANGFYIIKTGWLKVTKTSGSGREIILNLLGPGDSFNMIAMFTKSINPANVISLEESCLLYLDYKIIWSILDKTPDFSHRLLAQFAHRIQKLTELVGNISLNSVESRFASLLLEKAPLNVFVREKWLTQEEIAALIGTVPDVVSRVMRDFVEDGLIEFDRKKIKIMNRKALEEKINNIQFPT